MNTSSIELGSLLSMVAREKTDSSASGRDLRAARARPGDAVSAKAAEKQQAPPAALEPHAQRVQLNEALERVSRLDQRLSFRVDEGSGKSVVVVSDARTSEVLKQFPSEEMLNVARRLEEHLQRSGDAAGVLHAEEA